MKQRRRIGFVTCSVAPDITDDDRLLMPALEDLGYEVVAAAWDSPDTDWMRLDCCVFRSCWNFPFQLRAFQGWLLAMGGRGPHFFNPLSLVRWNLSKGYLCDLAERGLPIVPTHRIEQDLRSRQTLRQILEGRGWSEAVIKPDVGIGGFETWRVTLEEADGREQAISRMLETSGVLIQPYVPEIESQGEWSFVFFGNAFSHAVVKTPAPNEFRVHAHHGGSTRLAVPPAEWICVAQEALLSLGDTPLYSRIDAVPSGDGLLILEVELIEPILYLSFATEAPRRFAEAFRHLSG